MTTTGAGDADITGLLRAAQGGDRTAFSRLMPLVYEQLLALARSQRYRWRGDHTLNTVAIAHEAYLKLAGQASLPAGDRAHFFAMAAQAMRQVLCNYARDRQRLKRGGGAERVDLEDALAILPLSVSDDHAEQLAALDEALRRLEAINERLGKVVECRFFAGMTIEETAAALGLSPATVKRDWALASAWLYREIRRD